jgi:hypothetical protein
LRAAGIPSLLLKGPALAHRLYGDGVPRPYVDSDVLVRASTFEAAERALMDRGFVRASPLQEKVRPDWARHDHCLVRPGEDIGVELHWTLMHYAVDPELVWEAFNRNAATQRVGGVEVDIPADPQLALHTVIHVTEHGTMLGPAEDLRRALEQFPIDTWQAAHRLAQELGAEGAFATGLGMLPAGEAMAQRLGLRAQDTAAFSLQRIAKARGWRSKARVALRIAFPAPMYLRSFGPPIARRGPAGLAVAYLARPVELLVRAPGAVRAHRHGT